MNKPPREPMIPDTMCEVEPMIPDTMCEVEGPRLSQNVSDPHRLPRVGSETATT